MLLALVCVSCCVGNVSGILLGHNSLEAVSGDLPFLISMFIITVQVESQSAKV